MAITLTEIMGNSQLLDGGAMFGNVPKSMWSQWVTADEKNRIPLCTRAMLIQDGGRNILFETGIGAFFEPKLKARYGVIEEQHVLLNSLQDFGLTHEQVDIIVLSHLHFDHAGGLLTAWQTDKDAELLFPNATLLVGTVAFERAKHPHFRDRASFIPELIPLLEQSGRLQLINGQTSVLLGQNYKFHFSDGHTPGLMLTEVALASGPVVFVSDLIPGSRWVHLPVTMGYDRAPEQLINEKQSLLTDIHQRNGRLFYTHDSNVAISKITIDSKGRFAPTECMSQAIGIE